MNQNALQSVFVSNDVAAWDGALLKKLLALLLEWAPKILPFIIPLLGVKSVDDEKLQAAPDRELTAIDWMKIVKLLLELLAAFFNQDPVPVPTPTPVPPGPVA